MVPFLKSLTSNSCICSEAKGLEKKPRLARIADDKVIVYEFCDELSFSFLFVQSGVLNVFVKPFLKFMTSNSGLRIKHT